MMDWDIILYVGVMFFQPPVLRGEGIICMSVDRYKKVRMFSTSVSVVWGYH